MIRTCDRCGIGDDYYMMYYAYKKSTNELNVICGKCAQNYKDDYKGITSIHTITKNVTNEVRNRFSLMGNVKKIKTLQTDMKEVKNGTV